MYLKKVILQNFRNYSKKEFKFDGPTTLVVGPNTSGKTNLLEAIYLLATGKSFRAEVEAEMIKSGEEIARVLGTIAKTDLEIVLTTGSVGGRNAAKKKYQVNGVGKRMIDFVGQLKAVYFGPEDLQLVTDSPSLRRRYLDMVLSQVDREYRRAVLSYEKGVRQRNKVLEEIREKVQSSKFKVQSKEGEEGIRRRLYFWDQLLVKNGNYITGKREEFVEFLNKESEEGKEGKEGKFKLEYVKSVISPAVLEENFEKEVRAGMTLYGPHRDDIKFKLKMKDEKLKMMDKDLSIYGSRGEQRLAVLWLKMGELEYIAQKTGERPVLLLDDIFSELDEKHREIVLGVLGRQQTIITTTDEGIVKKNEREKMQAVYLS